MLAVILASNLTSRFLGCSVSILEEKSYAMPDAYLVSGFWVLVQDWDLRCFVARIRYDTGITMSYNARHQA
jgi:hypothetical protein